MYTFGDSFLDIAKGISQVATPLVSAGAAIYGEDQKNRINMERIRQGKQPCDSTLYQPRDCPLPLFAPKPPPKLPPGKVPAKQPASTGGGGGGILIFGLLIVGGIIAFFVLSGKKQEESSE